LGPPKQAPKGAKKVKVSHRGGVTGEGYERVGGEGGGGRGGVRRGGGGGLGGGGLWVGWRGC